MGNSVSLMTRNFKSPARILKCKIRGFGISSLVWNVVVGLECCHWSECRRWFGMSSLVWNVVIGLECRRWFGMSSWVLKFVFGLKCH